jgi:hypothetical protein
MEQIIKQFVKKKKKNKKSELQKVQNRKNYIIMTRINKKKCDLFINKQKKIIQSDHIF